MARPRLQPPADAAEGAHLLRKFIDERGLSIPDFADTHRFNRIQLQKLIGGETRRVSVDIAYAIERATDGHVPMESWRSRDEAA
jgi:plasmid maintenance system antidote protein VapI